VQGGDNTLQYFDAVPDASWADTQIANQGTTFLTEG
jgi:hypothetical protein